MRRRPRASSYGGRCPRAWRPGSTPQNVELGLGAIPIVAMGDLNSFQKRQPQGAQTVFYDFGFVDAFQAPLRINARFPTVNHPSTRQWRGSPQPFGTRDWPAGSTTSWAEQGPSPDA